MQMFMHDILARMLVIFKDNPIYIAKIRECVPTWFFSNKVGSASH